MAENEMMRLLGSKELKAELAAIEVEGDLATVAAVKAISASGRTRIRSRLRGRPRWNHRGASSRTGEAVNLGGTEHIVRAGGPGKFTGALYRGVGTVRKPKKLPGGYEGGVGIGGGVRNLYKGRLEQMYPYFRPAMDGLEPVAAEIWAKAWTRVIAKRVGRR